MPYLVGTRPKRNRCVASASSEEYCAPILLQPPNKKSAARLSHAHSTSYFTLRYYHCSCFTLLYFTVRFIQQLNSCTVNYRNCWQKPGGTVGCDQLHRERNKNRFYGWLIVCYGSRQQQTVLIVIFISDKLTSTNSKVLNYCSLGNRLQNAYNPIVTWFSNGF